MTLTRKTLLAWVATAVVTLAAALLAPFEMRLPAALIAACIALWLTEALPPFAPTLVLMACAPLVLHDTSPAAAQKTVLAWAADPVLALFFGGFVIGGAMRRHGVDARVAQAIVRRSRGDVRSLTALLMGGTAALSMWMSNVAAAAMMIAAARPALDLLKDDPKTRRRVLVALAMAANVAGLATPLGSGPNGIAIAAVEAHTRVTFGGWMLFGVPLTLGLLTVTYLLLRPAAARIPAAASPSEQTPLTTPAKCVVGLVAATIVVWLSEPLHGVPAAVVSLALAAALFASGLLDESDLERIDWSTLLLIAGGVMLGKLTEHTGLLDLATSSLTDAPWPPVAIRLVLCATAAVLAALMSNTATAALLIPIAMKLDPSPSAAILIAVATSLGVLFVISTPPNAMVVGEGVESRDLLRPGLVILVGGVVLVATTGPFVLALFGIR